MELFAIPDATFVEAQAGVDAGAHVYPAVPRDARVRIKMSE